jgi:ubiquinone/menaquinone biosynthesis C-methylase UbiE
MSDEHPVEPGLSFGSVAAAYDRGRPSYPADAVTWAVGAEAQVVLELGAGTGKLTAELVRQGHAVHATDPDGDMLEVLQARVPGCSARRASAEDVPANDRSVDVVVVGQAFHWFDHARALPEIARVLKRGGHLAIVHNERDQRIPWVRRLGDVLGQQDHDFTPEALVQSDLFGFVEEKAFKHWQDVNRESILDLARSRSNIATLEAEAQQAKLAEVRAFYDEYGRGMDGMQIPYVTKVFRARVVDTDEPATTEPQDEASHQGPIVSDGTDTDMLLIDFR